MDEDNALNTTKPNFSIDLFAKWQSACRGNGQADDMSNLVWEWMFRGRIDPNHANNAFAMSADRPVQPRWAGCRMGQSKTSLTDGRIIWIAGEHEDFYDPDFYIYNDVIVEQVDGSLKILGYSVEEFSPTDFHSATAVDNDSSIFIIGSIGYQNERREGFTPVYKLNTQSYELSAITTLGSCPGWIHNHTAELSGNGFHITIRGGRVLSGKSFIENIDDWCLCLETLTWTQLTDRKWPRFQLHRSDGKRLHLYDYSNIEFERQYPQLGGRTTEELEREIGIAPNIVAYRKLLTPSIAHKIQESKVDSESEWRTTRITVDDVQVRFVDDSNYLTVIAEGELSPDRLKSIVDELAEKLGRVENCSCTIRSIG